MPDFSRRGFLRRLGIGTVGVLALASVPAALVKTVGLGEHARLYACEHLRKVYNAYAKGRPASQHPKAMVCGRELFEAYEGELLANQRFTPHHYGPSTLMFKGAEMRAAGRGWYAKVTA